MNDNKNPQAQDTSIDRQLSRRQLLKTTGAGAGALAVGATGPGPIPRAVDDSDASVLLVAAAATVAGVAIGAGGMALLGPDDEELDPTKVAAESEKSNIYDTATSVAG